ncbi:methionyl-tRNA formyltransferase [Clostridium manihotivorum]|uniref:Methionyl-tRNA formyltransferase n=1 Tax=Clostridium manihotivorum TaxID=2320868 RepID=A0A410DY26_9CLOT|nr:methionyl-tRNA formyltransferase [Clostridium manihotivorum]QAA34086.1 methionyl-tRNA formyltransferase [Clostridium manihotivorum]
MTKVSKIEKIEKTKNSVHPDVGCTYCVFQDSGEKYLQIDTYKIGDIGMAEQSTQKIQFDKEFAVKLIEILKSEFNL